MCAWMHKAGCWQHLFSSVRCRQIPAKQQPEAKTNQKERQKKVSRKEEKNITPCLKEDPTFRLSHYQFNSENSPAQLQTINDCPEFRVDAGARRLSSNRIMLSYISWRINNSGVMPISCQRADKELNVMKTVIISVHCLHTNLQENYRLITRTGTVQKLAAWNGLAACNGVVILD